MTIFPERDYPGVALNDTQHWCPDVHGVTNDAEACECFERVRCPRCNTLDHWTKRQLSSVPCRCAVCQTNVASFWVGMYYDALMYWDWLEAKISQFLADDNSGGRHGGSSGSAPR